jgi:hypothetical protein
MNIILPALLTGWKLGAGYTRLWNAYQAYYSLHSLKLSRSVSDNDYSKYIPTKGACICGNTSVPVGFHYHCYQCQGKYISNTEVLKTFTFQSFLGHLDFPIYASEYYLINYIVSAHEQQIKEIVTKFGSIPSHMP